MRRLHRTILLTASALALLAVPTLAPQLPLLSASAAVAGNGNGNGKGGGNGGGNGGGSSNASDKSSRASQESKGGEITPKGKKAELAETAGESPRQRTRNLKAELGGLNSLKRNINGLMNSSDPRMAGIRSYVMASAALVAAEQAAKLADEALLDARRDYQNLLTDLGLPGDTTPDALEQAIAEFSIPADDPATEIDEAAEAIAARDALISALAGINESGVWTVLVDAYDAAQQAAQDVADAEQAVTPEIFDAALLQAANRNRQSSTYLTDDIRRWADGMVDGLVDAYVAQQN